MAEAQRTSTDIILRVNEDEALALYTILGVVGGDPNLSRRRHIDAIRSALTQADDMIFRDNAIRSPDLSGGSIRFEDEPQPYDAHPHHAGMAGWYVARVSGDLRPMARNLSYTQAKVIVSALNADECKS